jgi:hypothetical protein
MILLAMVVVMAVVKVSQRASAALAIPRRTWPERVRRVQAGNSKRSWLQGKNARRESCALVPRKMVGCAFLRDGG